LHGHEGRQRTAVKSSQFSVVSSQLEFADAAMNRCAGHWKWRL